MDAWQPTKTPAEIRKEGLISAGGAIGGLMLARAYMWLQVSFWPDHVQLPGVVLIIPPVLAAFGLTAVITGNDKSLLRLPLVVILAVVGIGLTFALLIPRGYELGPS